MFAAKGDVSNLPQTLCACLAHAIVRYKKRFVVAQERDAIVLIGTLSYYIDDE